MANVICFGSFDGLGGHHAAHLSHAASLGSLVCVAVEPDRSVLERTGQLPATGEAERLRLISVHESVPEARLAHPDELVEIATGLGADIIVIPFSDTTLRDRLNNAVSSKELAIEIRQSPPSGTGPTEASTPNEFPMDALPL